MSQLELEMLNEVFFKVKGLDRSSALEIKEFFSCKVENFWFSPKYKAKLWDGSISFFDWNNHIIPIGLFPQFVKFCNKFGYSYKLNIKKNDLMNDISDEEFEDFYDGIFTDSSFSPRDYQDECIKKALRFKRGIIESATGSGKSLIIYSIIRFILGIVEGKILLIVPNVSLVNQMFSDFEEYGFKNASHYCSLVFNKSDRVDFNKPIIISTWQSIYKKDISFFAKFQAVLVDETHGAKSTSIQSCLKKCINAEYRLGFTGTMPDEISNQFTIFGYLGPKIFELTSSELIDKGVLSKLKIANLLIQYEKEKIYKYWHDEDGNIKQYSYRDELELIYNFENRNKIFNKIFENITNSDNILILCHKISHLKSIKEYLQKNFNHQYEIYEIYGQIDADERERIRKLTDQKNNVIILGTYATMSTGINIKKLHHVIFASSYRSKIKVLQSIGRGLRKHETKDKLIVWDIVDDLTWINTWRDKEVLHVNHVYSHWYQRLQFYKNQGFEILTKKININD